MDDQMRKRNRWWNHTRVLIALVLSFGMLTGFSSVALADDDDFTGPRNNIVEVVNETNNAMIFRGKIQVNTINGGTVDPGNLAAAYSSCTGCNSLAVALQLNLVEGSPDTVAPENVAVALNEDCTKCYSWADAYQSTISVDDAEDIAEDIEDDVYRLNRKLHRIARMRNLSAAEVQARAEAVIAEFKALVAEIDADADDDRDDDEYEDDDRD